MAKGKHVRIKQQKDRGKEKRQKNGKVRRVCSDTLDQELTALGLRVQVVEADGNCLFRALADQLSALQEQEQAAHDPPLDHTILRMKTVAHMRSNREGFEPFVEDDEPFDNYMKRLEEDGTWAGNLELQAASMILENNICIHQSGQPVWSINNFPKAATIHISYHDQMHYNSVRKLANGAGNQPEAENGNSENGVSGTHSGKAPAKEAQASKQTRRKAKHARARSPPSGPDTLDGQPSRSVNADFGSPEEVAKQGGGDADHAEGAAELTAPEAPIADRHTSASDHSQAECEDGDESDAREADALQQANKQPGVKPMRNRPCPCGSAKKYKACCGQAKARRKSVPDSLTPLGNRMDMLLI